MESLVETFVLFLNELLHQQSLSTFLLHSSAQ